MINNLSMINTLRIMPSDLSCEYSEGENILQAALNNAIALEHSCKTGDCDTCKARLLEGSVIYRDAHVAPGEEFLTCISFGTGNITIQANYIPELAHISVKTVPAKVNTLRFVAQDIVELELRLPPTMKFQYLPGQYIDLSFQGVTRSYSIANTGSVAKSNIILLHIRILPQGAMSALLQEKIQANTLVRLNGPHGSFFVRSGQRPLLFIAGGTGFAPIKAMIEQLLLDADTRAIYLYWAAADITHFYSDLPNIWAQDYPHVQFIPVLSRINEEWSGRQGRIQDVVIADQLDISAFDIYACGSPALIESTKAKFLEEKMSPHHFYADAFTPHREPQQHASETPI